MQDCTLLSAGAELKSLFKILKGSSKATTFEGIPCKCPAIWTTFSFNLSPNIVALQVEILCSAYYRARDQLFLQEHCVRDQLA